jgi:hypothetical protein
MNKSLGSGYYGCFPFSQEYDMALIGANELKKKMLIEIEGQPFNVLDVFFATPPREAPVRWSGRS